MKNKNVQIPEQLLIDLCNYHIAGIRDPNLDMRIRQGLFRARNDTYRLPVC